MCGIRHLCMYLDLVTYEDIFYNLKARLESKYSPKYFAFNSHKCSKNFSICGIRHLCTLTWQHMSLVSNDNCLIKGNCQDNRLIILKAICQELSNVVLHKIINWKMACIAILSF